MSEAAEKRLISRWNGRFFEDFQVGDVYRSPHGRTVTEMDNLLFTHLTLNTNPVHYDARYAQQSQWGRILVNSTFTLSLIVGMSVPDVSQNAVANLGWDEVKLMQPVFIGDTLYCDSEVLARRESKSHPEAGIVTVRTRGINQEGYVVIDFKRTIMIYKRGCAPDAQFPTAIRHPT